MSFLNIRGEKIYCEKCGAVCTIEYEGGMQPTQIGDMSVTQQIELSKQLMSDYDAEKYGYYYHRFAICRHCAGKKLFAKFFDDNYILFQYLDDVELLLSLRDDSLSEAAENLKKHLSGKLLKEINPEAYDVLIHTKHFDIKKEKMRIAERYVEQSQENIFAYVNKKAMLNPEWIMQKNQTIQTEKDILNALSEHNLPTSGFVAIDIHSERNLNPHICYDYTIRTPETIEGEQEFYQPFKYSKTELLNLAKDQAKYECFLDEYDFESLLKKLPPLMIKIDWGI